TVQQVGKFFLPPFRKVFPDLYVVEFLTFTSTHNVCPRCHATNTLIETYGARRTKTAVSFRMIGISVKYFLARAQVLDVGLDTIMLTNNSSQFVDSIRFIGADIEDLVVCLRDVHTFRDRYGNIIDVTERTGLCPVTKYGHRFLLHDLV